MPSSIRSQTALSLLLSQAALAPVALLLGCSAPADSENERSAETRESVAAPSSDDAPMLGSAALRAELTSMPPAPALAQAVAAFKQADPSATFTWLRGHVDSFAARPKNVVPDYARAALEAAGLSTAARVPPKLATRTTPNVRRNLDDLSVPLPYRSEAPANVSGESAPNDVGGAPPPASVPRDTRKPLPFVPSEPAAGPGEGAVAKAILVEFLRRHAAVFEVDSSLLGAGLPNLKLVRFGAGKFGRRAVFQQYVGSMPLLDGKTVVLFDVNWNVTAVSRQITTPAKLSPPTAGGPAASVITARAVTALAERYGQPSAAWTVREATRGVDVVRGRIAWQVRALVASTPELDYTVTIDAVTGNVVNISENADHFTDAQLLRWGYGSGDFTLPSQFTATNFYTRDSNSLEHDFFYLANDDRTNGALGTCNATPDTTQTASAAYGTTTSGTYIRPTQRNDRDFTLWQPSEDPGTFGEGQAYYWGRWYMQWLKESLDLLGVLPASTADYPRALLLVNACQSGAGVHLSSFAVTTLDNKGEGTNTILLPERCRSENSNCASTDHQDSNSDFQYSFKGSGGYHAPGVLHHELNHFVLRAYYDVSSTLDCAVGNELKYLHEGGLGRTIPQMYWHHYYGVGYAPAQNRLFQSDDASGAPHTDSTDINTWSNWQCGPSDSTDPNYVNPYSAGGIVAQPLWEIYHGQEVDGSVLSGMASPADDIDMLISTYAAIDLVSGSTWKDRFEMANRFMEYWEFNSSALPTTKADWCDAFSHHGIGTWINSSYCS